MHQNKDFATMTKMRICFALGASIDSKFLEEWVSRQKLRPFFAVLEHFWLTFFRLKRSFSPILINWSAFDALSSSHEITSENASQARQQKFFNSFAIKRGVWYAFFLQKGTFQKTSGRGLITLSISDFKKTPLWPLIPQCESWYTQRMMEIWNWMENRRRNRWKEIRKKKWRHHHHQNLLQKKIQNPKWISRKVFR